MLGSVIEVRVEAHTGRRGRCSQCQRACPGYDRQDERRWQFVQLWGIPVWFVYAPRRVDCPEHWGGGAYSMERREAPADNGDDGISGALGAAAELARDGRGVPDELGGGLSLGAVVRGVGPEPLRFASAEAVARDRCPRSRTMCCERAYSSP